MAASRHCRHCRTLLLLLLGAQPSRTHPWPRPWSPGARGPPAASMHTLTAPAPPRPHPYLPTPQVDQSGAGAIDSGTLATVIGGLLGVALLGYLGLKL